MRTKEELIREVEDRNKFRGQVGLPLVSLNEEVKKLEEAERRKDCLAWCDQNSSLIARIQKEVLALERKERDKPNWIPTLLNGGEEFGKRVRQRLLKELKEDWCGFAKTQTAPETGSISEA